MSIKDRSNNRGKVDYVRISKSDSVGNIQDCSEDLKKTIEKLENVLLACITKKTIEEYELSDIKYSASEIGGMVFSNISNAGNFYYHDKYASPRGHGFAAEDANHLYDVLHGKNAELVGADNAKHGADRLVDGISIQTKFCKTGSKCIEECFENNNFKYYAEGKPMQIEVPFDKYEGAIKAMENRIRTGQVEGIIDPAEAKYLVKQSPYTYQQAKNIAKAGNIDSIKFDAQNGAIISLSAFGITAVLTFATSIWSGDSLDVAIEKSVVSGIKVGGITFLSSILSSQLSKAGLNSMLVGSSEVIVKMMGPKASAVIVNALKSGKNIYGGAAMKSLAKLLRGNIITGGVTIVLLSSVDVVDIFQGKISGKQLFKNITTTTTSVAGGTAGWLAGAAAAGKLGVLAGAVVPGIGNIIGGTVGVIAGGVIGAMSGGTIAGKATNAVVKQFIEDDAVEMIDIIQKVFLEIANEHLLNKDDGEKVTEKVQKILTPAKLKDMFASSNRKQFARETIAPLVKEVASDRKKIKTFDNDQMFLGMKKVLEKIYDENKVVTQ